MVSEGNLILSLGLRATERQRDLESGTLHLASHFLADDHIACGLVARQGTGNGPATGLVWNSSGCWSVLLVVVGGI